MSQGGGRAIGDESGSIRRELDAEADRQMKGIERDMAELEREIHAATGGVFEKPLAEFVQSLETEDGEARALLDGMTSEERERAKRDYLEAMSRTVDVPAGVLEVTFALEAEVKKFPPEARRQGLAHALWRAVSGLNESERMWTESITLRDGGRKVSFELLALWNDDEVKGGR